MLEPFFNLGMLMFMSHALVTTAQDGYELLDSGEGRKLERFGPVVLDRPDPQIVWKKENREIWNKASARFEKEWHGRKNIPVDWEGNIGGLTLRLKLAAFKHVGVFPEQCVNWEYIRSRIERVKRPVSVLNIFGYTGGATIAALQAGASVVHVDSSKTSIGFAMENAELSKVPVKKVRWILEDALSFLKREVRRGNTYDVIIMDPPASGRGAKGEVWKIEDNLSELVELTEKLLSKNPLFVLLNGYAAGYSHVSYAQLLESVIGSKHKDFSIFSGELFIKESYTERLLPAGIYARIDL